MYILEIQVLLTFLLVCSFLTCLHVWDGLYKPQHDIFGVVLVQVYARAIIVFILLVHGCYYSSKYLVLTT